MENNLDLLKIHGLPVFEDSNELAKLIHFTPKRINALAVRNSRFYKAWSVPKKGGGVRVISQPSEELKAVQGWILRNILDNLSPSVHATAFISGKSLKENVSPHSNNSFFLCIDIENFFPSIPFLRVFHVFRTIGYSKANSWTLSRLCTFKGSLPQGGVTSPSLTNIIAAKLDRRLGGYSSQKKLTYTRYCDDMVFSSTRPEAIQIAFPMIKKIVRSEGFELNHQKTRFMGPYKQCKITGLVRNSASGSFNVCRQQKRLLRSAIHRIESGKYATLSKRQIEGWISFINSINAEDANKIREYWEQLK